MSSCDLFYLMRKRDKNILGLSKRHSNDWCQGRDSRSEDNLRLFLALAMWQTRRALCSLILLENKGSKTVLRGITERSEQRPSLDEANITQLQFWMAGVLCFHVSSHFFYLPVSGQNGWHGRLRVTGNTGHALSCWATSWTRMPSTN